MKINHYVADIFEQQMTRKEFLQHIGIATVLLLGGGYILNVLNVFDHKPTGQRSGYSSGAYGGGSEDALRR